MFANKTFLLIELSHTYGPSLLATLASTGAIVWHTKSSSRDATSRIDRHDSKFDTIDPTLLEHDSKFYTIDSRLLEHDSRVDKLEAKIQDTQSTSLGLVYTLMKGLSGKKDNMNEWMGDIEKCVGSGGKDCDRVKGIPFYRKEIQKKK